MKCVVRKALFAGLERNPNREGFREALAGLGSFPGLQGAVRMNRAGDPERETFLAVIRDGQFTTTD
jgi:ABC-type branched-subunit amino acid transport system substrate-binding protein